MDDLQERYPEWDQSPLHFKFFHTFNNIMSKLNFAFITNARNCDNSWKDGCTSIHTWEVHFIIIVIRAHWFTEPNQWPYCTTEIRLGVTNYPRAITVFIYTGCFKILVPTFNSCIFVIIIVTSGWVHNVTNKSVWNSFLCSQNEVQWINKIAFQGTNEMTFLRDKWNGLFEGQMKWPFERQMKWPFWGTNEIGFWRDKLNHFFEEPWNDLFGRQMKS